MFAFRRRTRKPSRSTARFERPWLEELETRLAPASVQLISVADPTVGGGTGSSQNTRVAISPDGRYVAFESEASFLVPGDTNDRTDVFVRDTLLQTTTRVSTDSAGQQGNSHSYAPALAVDPSGAVYVSFTSWADNLVPGDT